VLLSAPIDNETYEPKQKAKQANNPSLSVMLDGA
jgi:hypothetical protein